MNTPSNSHDPEAYNAMVHYAIWKGAEEAHAKQSSAPKQPADVPSMGKKTLLRGKPAEVTMSEVFARQDWFIDRMRALMESDGGEEALVKAWQRYGFNGEIIDEAMTEYRKVMAAEVVALDGMTAEADTDGMVKASA